MTVKTLMAILKDYPPDMLVGHSGESPYFSLLDSLNVSKPPYKWNADNNEYETNDQKVLELVLNGASAFSWNDT